MGPVSRTSHVCTGVAAARGVGNVSINRPAPGSHAPRTSQRGPPLPLLGLTVTSHHVMSRYVTVTLRPVTFSDRVTPSNAE